MTEVRLEPMPANIDWRWRNLYQLVLYGMRDERAAKCKTAILLHARRRADDKVAHLNLNH